MTRRLSAALLAVALISQPTCMRADGEDVILKAAAGVVIIGGIWYVCQPDSNETAVKKARSLIADVDASLYYPAGSERDTQSFAYRYLRGSSFEETRQKTIKERDAVLKAHDDMRVRTAKADHAEREILKESQDRLNQTFYALNTKLAYLDQYAPYFKFYVANERGCALLERGCPSGYNNECAQDFRNAMEDIENTKNGASLTSLHNHTMTDTYPKLVKKYGDINKQIAENRNNQNEAAAWVAGQVVRGIVSGVVQAALTPPPAPAQPQPQQQARQTTAQQQEQAAVEQAKKNSMVTAHQEEALRQAKARQEQERRQAAVNQDEQAVKQAKQNSIDTFNKEQEDRAKKNSLETNKQEEEKRKKDQLEALHQNCPPDRCLKGLSQQQCPAQQRNHAQCTHDTCYKGSAAQCPAFQAHRNCNDIWCSYHQDAWCPRFHDRSNLKH